MDQWRQKFLKRPVFIFCVLAFFVARTSCEASLYVGIEGVFTSVLPKVFWTNPLDQWIEQNRLSFEQKEGEYYAINKVESPAYSMINQWFTGNHPENIALNKRVNNVGLGLFFGGNKKLNQKFYLGVEGKVKYKHLELVENEKDKILLDCPDGVFFLRTEIKGQVSYSTKIDCYKKLETDAVIRFGYAPVNSVLCYIETGVSLSQLMINQIQIDLPNPELKMKRYDDETKIEDSPPPDPKEAPGRLVGLFPFGQYSPSERRLYFPSLILGAGLEKVFGKNFFIRLEYNFQIAIASKMHAISDEGIGRKFEKSSIEYALRYQDTEHQAVLGIGRKF